MIFALGPGAKATPRTPEYKQVQHEMTVSMREMIERALKAASRSDSGMKWLQAVILIFRIGVPARISPFPLRKTKISVTRPEVTDRLPLISFHTGTDCRRLQHRRSAEFGARKLQADQLSTICLKLSGGLKYVCLVLPLFFPELMTSCPSGPTLREFLYHWRTTNANGLARVSSSARSSGIAGRPETISKTSAPAVATAIRTMRPIFPPRVIDKLNQVGCRTPSHTRAAANHTEP